MTSAKEWANLLCRSAWVSEGDVQAIMDATRAETLEEAARLFNGAILAPVSRARAAASIRALAASPKPRGEG